MVAEVVEAKRANGEGALLIKLLTNKQCLYRYIPGRYYCLNFIYPLV